MRDSGISRWENATTALQCGQCGCVDHRCVLRIAVDKQKELTTVVGVAPGVAVGQHVTAEGQWVK